MSIPTIADLDRIFMEVMGPSIGAQINSPNPLYGILSTESNTTSGTYLGITRSDRNFWTSNVLPFQYWEDHELFIDIGL